MARQRKSGAAELPVSAEQSSSWDGSDADAATGQDSLPQEQLASATTPGGMVRIGKGTQQRCIWPVHLAGWQQLGWTVLGAQGTEPQSAELRTAGRRSAKPEPPIEPLNPPLEAPPDLDPLAWDDTTSEQP